MPGRVYKERLGVRKSTANGGLVISPQYVLSLLHYSIVQRVHVEISYILRAQRVSVILTLAPKCPFYELMSYSLNS